MLQIIGDNGLLRWPVSVSSTWALFHYPFPFKMSIFGKFKKWPPTKILSKPLVLAGVYFLNSDYRQSAFEG